MPGKPVPRTDETQPADGGASRPLRRTVAGLVALEAVLLVLGAGFLGVGAVTTPNDAALPATVFLIMLALAIAVVLAFSALAVLDGERWTRGPIVTWQLLQAGVAMPVSLQTPLVGLPLLAIAVAVFALVAGRRVIVRRPGD